jgi:hypothetical protein
LTPSFEDKRNQDFFKKKLDEMKKLLTFATPFGMKV